MGSDAVPVSIQYRKLGSESDASAERAGAMELDAGNRCLSLLVSDAKVRSAMGSPLERAVSQASAAHAGGESRLVIKVSHGSLELVYELVKGGKKLLRERVVLSSRPGSFGQRIDRKECGIPEKKTSALAALIMEPARRSRCQKQIAELVSVSKKLSYFAHEYVPDPWLNQAKEAVGLNSENMNFLPRRLDEFESPVKSFAECQGKLARLRDYTEYSAKVLEAAAQIKPELSLPFVSIEKARVLINEAK